MAPTDVYPLYENACRASWGQSLAEAQTESAEIWAGFSRVAAGNPDAWLRNEVTAAQVLEVSSNNRPIAFPYTKLMVANASVNQGAAFIVTSLAKAKAAGVGETQLIYIVTSNRDTYALKDEYFSYRHAIHAGEKDYGRQISAIMIKA